MSIAMGERPNELLNNYSPKSAYLTVKEAAFYLNISRFSLWRLIKNNNLPVLYLNGARRTGKYTRPRVRISKKALAAWIDRNSKE